MSKAYVAGIVTITAMTTVDGNILWTLRNRAAEARRSHGVLDDPWAAKRFNGPLRRTRSSVTILEFGS